MNQIQTRTLAFLFWVCALAASIWILEWKWGLAVLSRYTSQALFVPILAGYLLWSERKDIFVAPASSWQRAAQLCGLAVAGALLAYYFSRHSNAYLFSLFAVISALALLMAGFSGAFGGRAMVRALFPLSLLLLMIPLPDSFLQSIINILRTQSASLCAVIFSAVGIPVYKDGFLLVLPGVTIEIANECSGINSSVALTITMLLIARQTLCSNWRRFLLVLIAIPLSVLKNALRISTLTILALRVDPSFLTGKLHHQGGFVFYLLAILLMYPVWIAIKRGDSSSRQDRGEANLWQGRLSKDARPARVPQ